MDADVIVVGAGAAGSVVAGRLARLGVRRILVIEAGGHDRDPRLHVPMAFHLAMQAPRLTHRYPADAIDGGPAETWVRGRVVGGSTAINGMLYLRGDPDDYDALAAAGNPGWTWAQVGAAFEAMEDHAAGPGPGRGVGGPQPVTVAAPHGELVDAVLDAAQRLGVPRVDDVNAAVGERIGGAPSTIRDGRRVSASRAFLRSAVGRGVQLLTRTSVDRLLFDGARVVGVRVRRGRTVQDLRARREVIVAAGTIGSPLLLERSGIGDADVLGRAGIALRVVHPNVGERVVEQRAVTLKLRVRPGLGTNPLLDTAVKRARAAGRYLRHRDDLLGRGPFELVALVRASDDADRPYAQLLITTMATDDTGLALASHAGLMVQGYPLRPTTHSSIHARGPRPEDGARIVPRFLGTDRDRRTSAAILGRARELVASDPVRDLVVEEVAPGPSVSSIEDVTGYALATGAGIYHAVGSCAMGPADDDVVDAELRVRRVDGLRVVDASVLPTMLSGGTAAPTMAVAWRAAELIAS